MRKSSMIVALVAITALPGVSQAQYNQPTGGGPLSSIFSCAAGGNRQATGAVIGGLLGGAVGNQVADNERGLGTVLGAAVGAAAGSYIGCRMQVGDQQRAQSAAQLALDQGQNQSWTNPQTGAQGQIRMVSTQPYQGQGGYNQGGYNNQGNYNQGGYNNQPQQPRPINMNGLRFASGVEPLRSYVSDGDRYSAGSTVNLRALPSARARVIGSLRSGENVEALARVEGTDWILAGRNGQAIGYVDDMALRRQVAQNNNLNNNNNNNNPYRICRTFDQTFTSRGGQPETQRYTACQTASGEWIVQG